MVVEIEHTVDVESTKNSTPSETKSAQLLSLTEKHFKILKSLNLLDKNNINESSAEFPPLLQLDSLLKIDNWQTRVTAILGNYKASLSSQDSICLEILRFFEQRYSFVCFDKLQPLVWDNYGKGCYENLKKFGFQLWRRPSIDDLLKNNIRADVMLKSSLNLPLDITIDYQADELYEDLYDPRFFLPLFNGFFKAECLVDCKLFIKSNCLFFVLVCLSLRDNTLRKCAYSVLYKFRLYLTSSTVKFDEKSIILHLLTTLRNSIKKPNAKLSSIFTLFLAKAFRILLQPDHRMFQAINSFLLLKPTLDIDDIPEFYKFFHSTATSVNERTKFPDFLFERHWMLELLSQGLRQRRDYSIFKRRFVTKLLLSFFAADSSLCDKKSRFLILDILRSACRLKSVAIDLCFESNFFAWILYNLNNNACNSKTTILADQTKIKQEPITTKEKYATKRTSNVIRDEESGTIILVKLAEILLILRSTMLVKSSNNENAWKTVKISWITCACSFLNHSRGFSEPKSNQVTYYSTICDQVKCCLSEELNEFLESSEKQLIKSILLLDEVEC